MFKCPNPAHIVQIRDFSCKKVQSTDSYFFSSVLSFFPVWSRGEPYFVFQCLPSLNIKILDFSLPVVPHKAVAEVSKMENL